MRHRPAKLATWQTNTVNAVPETDGPLRVGSESGKPTERPGAKKIEELVEVAEYEPDRVLGLRNIEGPPVRVASQLEPTERGTRFRFRVCGQPAERRASSNPLLRFILKRNFQHVCTTLKRVLEDATAKA